MPKTGGSTAPRRSQIRIEYKRKENRQHDETHTHKTFHFRDRDARAGFDPWGIPGIRRERPPGTDQAKEPASDRSPQAFSTYLLYSALMMEVPAFRSEKHGRLYCLLKGRTSNG